MDWLLKKLDFFTVTDSPSSSSVAKIDICQETTAMIRNRKLISELTVEDLDDLENDLSFYEKVSLVFLLYGNKDPHYSLERLILVSQNSSLSTQLLSDWKRRNENKWQETIIEALCIANINHVLVKLGLDLNDLRVHYLPYNPETNIFVHPILKGLYIMCETLTPDVTEELIEFMREKFQTSSNRIHTSDYLELHLLDWIANKSITLGKDNQYIQIKDEFCDISPIVAYLKLKDLDNIKEILKNMSNRYNYTKNNVIGRDKSNNTRCDKMGDEKFKEWKSDSEVKQKNISDNSSNSADTFEKYKIEKSNAGYILIINQKYFFKGKNSNPKEQQLKTRLGTEYDKNSLLEAFTPYGFEPDVRDDLTDVDIIKVLKETVTKSKTKDALIVCILSHGRKGSIFSSDSVEVRIDDIKRIMTSKELLGKPKLLIIQACQNESTEDNIPYLEHDGIPEERYDMITAYSTVPGHVSFRHIEEGSWFIQTICSVIKQHGKKQHLLDISTEVNNILSQKKGSQNEKMTPIWEINLTKKFYLPLE